MVSIFFFNISFAFSSDHTSFTVFLYNRFLVLNASSCNLINDWCCVFLISLGSINSAHAIHHHIFFIVFFQAATSQSGNFCANLPALYHNLPSVVVMGVANSSVTQDKNVQAPHFLHASVNALGHILDNHFRFA